MLRAKRKEAPHAMGGAQGFRFLSLHLRNLGQKCGTAPHEYRNRDYELADWLSGKRASMSFFIDGRSTLAENNPG